RADLRAPGELGVRRDHVAQQRRRAVLVDGEIIATEANDDLASIAFRPGLDQQQLLDHAFIRAKANRIATETGHRTKLASIRAPAAGFHRDSVEVADSRPVPLG